MRLSELNKNVSVQSSQRGRLSDFGISVEQKIPETQAEKISTFGTLKEPREVPLAEKAMDVAFPIGGGIIGGFLGPEGLIIGAGAGKIIAESIKQYGNPEPTILQNVSSVLGEGIKESIGTALFTKAGLTAGKKIAQSFPKNGVATFISKFLGYIPEPAKRDTIALTSQKVAKDLGVQRTVTERAIAYPERVLTDEFLDITKKSPLTRQTIGKMENISKQAFETTKKQYDKVVTPLLDKYTNNVPIVDTYNNFLSNSTDIVKFNKAGKIIPSARIDKEAARTLNEFNADFKALMKDATPKNLHKFKQYINSILERKVARDNPSLQKILQDTHKDIRNKIEGVVSGYKQITDDYAFLFEAESELGSYLKSRNVENLVKKYLTDNAEGFRIDVDSFLSKDKTAQKIFNDALDEAAGFEFSSRAGQAFRPSFAEIGEKIGRAVQRRSEIPYKQVPKLRGLKSSLDKRTIRSKIFDIGSVTQGKRLADFLFSTPSDSKDNE